MSATIATHRALIIFWLFFVGLFIHCAWNDQSSNPVSVTGRMVEQQVDAMPHGIKRQVIVLKADDLIYNQAHVISPAWQRFIDFIQKRNIKASLGVIGNSLEIGNIYYFAFLKYLHRTGHFELWNHGYDHVVNQKDAHGQHYSEFLNRPYTYQKEHLEKTQYLAKTKLGITMRTFGAPGNAIDQTTLQLIDENEDIVVWFFGNPHSKKWVLLRQAEIEYPINHPNYHEFLQHYQPKCKYYVFQLHPNSWDERRFAEFVKIIDFLIARNAIFATAYEYYQTTFQNPGK